MNISKAQQYLLTIVILIIFCLVPHYFLGNSLTILLPLLILISILVYKRQGGWSILILALSFCFPYSGYFSEETTVTISNAMRLPYNVMRGAILLIFLYSIFIQKKNAPSLKKTLLLFILLIILSTYYYIINDDKDEVILNISWFIYTYLSFYVAFFDKISIKHFFYFLDLIFFCTLFYEILEFIFNLCPYQSIYDDYIYIEEIGRAKGLLGHPLVLSSFLCFYQVALYAKIILFQKVNVLNFFLLILAGLMTASRTVIILFLVCFILYFLLSGMYKNPKIYVLTAILIGFSFLILKLNFNVFIENTKNRSVSASSDQRIGAYSIISEVFYNHPLGVGTTGLKKEIRTGGYNSSLYDKDLFVIDNMYLSSIGKYGIFAIFIFYLYFQPIFFFKKNYHATNKKIISIVFILYIIWILQNFSFDTNAYVPINIFFFMFLAVLAKELDHKKIIY